MTTSDQPSLVTYSVAVDLGQKLRLMTAVVPVLTAEVERAHPARIASVAIRKTVVRQVFTGASALLPVRTRPSRIGSGGLPVKQLGFVAFMEVVMARVFWAATLAVIACSGGKMDNSPRGRVALLLPTADKSSLTAPTVFHAKFETSAGNFVVEVHRDWAPSGADRF